MKTYDLVVTDDSHDTQRLHSKLFRRKRGIGALISEHDVWVNVGVQVINAEALDSIFECGLALAAGVI